MIQLGEDPTIDLGQRSPIQCHHFTSRVDGYTGGNLLQVRVGLTGSCTRMGMSAVDS